MAYYVQGIFGVVTVKLFLIKETVREGTGFLRPIWRPYLSGSILGLHLDPDLSRAALLVHRALLPISIAELILSQGWMIVILDSTSCVGIFAY